MAQVSDFVSLELSVSAAALTAPGFGKPLILAYDCPAGFQGIYQEFSEPGQLLTLGFSASGATYQAALKMMSQSPRPPIFAVGFGALPPTQEFTLTVSGTITVGQVFSLELDGQEYSVTVAAAWAIDTNYKVGQLVSLGGYLYECTAAGESAGSGGPTGQGNAPITDGTVTWQYVGYGTHTLTPTGVALSLAEILGDTATVITNAWASSTDYSPGVVVANGGNLYICTGVVGVGESATSGGPTGTGTNIADFQTASTNGVYWAYVAPLMTISVSAGVVTLLSAASAATQFHSLSVTPNQTTNMAVAQTHVDPGVATDLAAILVQNATWYGLCTLFNSYALVKAAAIWAVANDKLYAVQTQDSVVINGAPLQNNTTDIGVELLSLGEANTAGGAAAIIYKSTTNDFADAAWLGACLPLIPGSETWAFKSLVSVAAESGIYALTETQRSNACGSLSNPGGKQVNLYENVGGANITEKGTVSSSSLVWIDLVRGLAWLQANMSVAVFSGIIAGEKLPYTDAGIAVVQAAMLAVLKQGITNGLLTNNPAPSVSVPLASSVSESDKQNRLLENVSFDAETAGAIQGVSIQGNVSF